MEKSTWSLPGGPWPDSEAASLSDTPMHAAVTALAVAAHGCPDPVRASAAKSLFPLMASSVTGDGASVRGRASTLVTLVHCAAEAEPSSAPMLYALERWALHPGRDTAAELTDAAARSVAGLPSRVRRQAWVCGPGLDRALAEVDRLGFAEISPEALSVIAEASGGLVPVIWLAQRSCTTRDAVHRRLRALRTGG